MQILKDAWPHLLGIFVFAFLSYTITTAASAANARLAALARLLLAQANLLILVTRLPRDRWIQHGCLCAIPDQVVYQITVRNQPVFQHQCEWTCIGFSYIGEARAKDKLKYNLPLAARMVGIPAAVFWLECLTSSLLSGFGITTTGTPHNKTAVEFNKTITCWTYL